MGLPPGRNVGTQLRARRRREQRLRDEAAAGAAGTPAKAAARPAQLPLQLALPDPAAWFAAQGWTPFDFQREVWAHIAAGRGGLLHATTGAGKTYALWFGLLAQVLAEPAAQRQAEGLRLLWITPMRALSADTAAALRRPLAELGLDWTVGVRTSDTESAQRRQQDKALPQVLVTTPESLTLLLSRSDCVERFSRLSLVVVDEWHELLGSKRGVQAQLALARLRRFAAARAAPLPVWGLSATLGNLAHAAEVLLGEEGGALVSGRIDKSLTIDTLIPDPGREPGALPWGGHLGLRMLDQVAAEIDRARSTLVFTNTRSQAEIWYQALLDARPAWAGLIALHHGSLDREVRAWVEAALKDGRLKAVVATSSLDLGVDFLPVERVIQIGSPKGIARLLQRAGRSGHAPGRSSRITIVPTHALELAEAAAARAAAQAGQVEALRAPERPIDALVQHLVTVALGTGFDAESLLAEVRQTWSFRQLSDGEFAWALNFAGGGGSLAAYPEFHRIVERADRRWGVDDRRIAAQHRSAIGTIVAESAMQVRWSRGAKAASGTGRLGTIEEGFIARLRPGDAFVFAGRRLELVRIEQMTAYVRPASGRRGTVPRWAGGRMPFSNELAQALLLQFDQAEEDRFESAEMQRLAPLLRLQRRRSALPGRNRLVVETMRSDEGQHLFVYPFAGRAAHIGLASLLAWRAARQQAATFSIAANDYGFELLCPGAIDWRTQWLEHAAALLGEEDILEHTLQSLNAGELARRRFREIARVAGLVHPGPPGRPKPARQLQAGAGLFFDVLRRHDAGNLLLAQAEREVLEQELEAGRLRSALARMRQQRLAFRVLARPTPFSLPLVVERLRDQMSTETIAARLERMLAQMSEDAGEEAGGQDGEAEAAPYSIYND